MENTKEVEEWKLDQTLRAGNALENGEITVAEYERRLKEINDPRKNY